MKKFFNLMLIVGIATLGLPLVIAQNSSDATFLNEDEPTSQEYYDIDRILLRYKNLTTPYCDDYDVRTVTREDRLFYNLLDGTYQNIENIKYLDTKLTNTILVLGPTAAMSFIVTVYTVVKELLNINNYKNNYTVKQIAAETIESEKNTTNTITSSTKFKILIETVLIAVSTVASSTLLLMSLCGDYLLLLSCHLRSYLDYLPWWLY